MTHSFPSYRGGRSGLEKEPKPRRKEEGGARRLSRPWAMAPAAAAGPEACWVPSQGWWRISVMITTPSWCHKNLLLSTSVHVIMRRRNFFLK